MEDAFITATLICVGILEKCPGFQMCIAHGGGPTCVPMNRIDRSRSERRQEQVIPNPPSSYQRKLYYDSITISAPPCASS